MSILNLIIGGVQLIAGIVLTASGIGGGLGLKLILSGALSLISSFMNAKSGRGGVSSSSAYGFDNLNNDARAGGAIPVVYGSHIRTPECINLNQIQEGDNQTLWMLCLLSEGPIQGVGQVYLNGQKIETFGGTATAKLGTSDQTAFTEFAMGGTGYDAGTRLTYGVTHTFDMRDANVDQLALGFVWPGGLWKQNKDGGADTTNVGVLVEYRAYGSTGAWTKFPGPSQTAGTATDPWYGDPGYAGAFKVDGRTTGLMRRLLRLKFDGGSTGSVSARPAKGRYQVRLTGTIDDISGYTRVPTIATIVEIRSQSVAYANRAVLSVKCPGVAQLGTSMPRVSVVVNGRTIYDPRAGTTAWSDNPALCVRDLLLSERYGLGQWITSDMIDDGVGGSFRTVADSCDVLVTKPGPTAATEKHWTLNYVMDVKSPATDYLTEMLSSFRATLFAADGLIRIGQDTTGASTHSFEDRAAASADTRRNVVHAQGEGGYGDRSLLTAHVLEDSQRWNVVRAYYIDAEKDWARRYIELRNKSIAIGAITGTFTAGETLKVGTGKSARFVFQRGGVLYYVQDDGATALATAEAVTGLTSGATCTTAGAPVTSETPERALEVNLFGVTRRTQAIREMRYHLNRALITPIFAQIPIGIGDIDVLPCDVIDVSSDYPGAWAAKLFTTLSIGFGQQGMGVIAAREYAAGVYVDTVDSTVVDLPTSTNGGGPVGSGGNGTGTFGGTGTTVPNTDAFPVQPAASTPTPTTTTTTVTVTWGNLFGSKK